MIPFFKQCFRFKNFEKFAVYFLDFYLGILELDVVKFPSFLVQTALQSRSETTFFSGRICDSLPAPTLW